MPRRDQTAEAVKAPPVKATTKAPTPPKAQSKTTVVSETDATISYEISVTKKIGEFEFMKLTAGVTVPVNASDELLDDIDASLPVIRDRIILRLEKDFESINL